MLNPWFTYENESLCWALEFPDGHPVDALRAWQRRVLESGERHRVYRVRAVRALDYRAERDGFLADFLDDHPDRLKRALPYQELIPGVVFNEGLWLDVSAVLAVDLAEGRVGEVEAETMSPLTALPSVFTHRYDTTVVPLELRGRQLLDDEGRSGPYRCEVVPGGNIWFPWNPAPYDLLGADGDFLDNRRLASRNSARLNAFLREVTAATAEAGGAWLGAVDVSPSVAFQVDDDGVLLDAEHRLDVVWDAPPAADPADAVGAGLAWFAAHPPPAGRQAVIRVALTADSRWHAATTEALTAAVATAAGLAGYAWSAPDAVAKVQITNDRGEHLLGRRRLAAARG
ncbi:hypothetical protein DN069_09990 [Streptacidiphilus pinicola]|uniref:Uncharacterized protein n=1 Tax=Streptacidiphilus pinicola TaxID=2219663 RepID=A0A2X0K971_9ACTN|nr:hypothetical protein [Streptacidiphilus pinicola]RAG85825.1 hypothetical protein DN069_09990 [Streptacidiphilus pinicola]